MGPAPRRRATLVLLAVAAAGLLSVLLLLGVFTGDGGLERTGGEVEALAGGAGAAKALQHESASNVSDDGGAAGDPPSTDPKDEKKTKESEVLVLASEATDVDRPALERRVLEGRVLDFDDGTPLVGALVRGVGADVDRPEVVTDADGWFQIRGSFGGSTSAEVSFPAGYFPTYSPVRFDLATVEMLGRAITVHLRRDASLAVAVVDSDKDGVAGLRVRVSTRDAELFPDAVDRWLYRGEEEWSSVTGVWGECVVDAIPARVTTSLELWRGEELVHFVRELPPLAPGEERALEIELADCAALRGTVVDEAGLPMEGAEVVLGVERSGDDGAPVDLVVGTTRSDPGGRFDFPCVHAGEWTVRARRDEFVPAATGVVIEPNSVPKELRIVLGRGAYLAGVVVDADGRPAERSARVTVERPFGGSEPLSVATEAEGAFRVGPLSKGEYLIQALPSGIAGAPSESYLVEAGRPSFSLALRKDGRLKIALVASDGRPAVGRYLLTPAASSCDSFGGFFGALTRLRRQFAETEVARGSADVEGLAPGKYRLVVQTQSEIGMACFELGEGESSEARMQLGLAGVLRVQCARAYANVWVQLDVSELYHVRLEKHGIERLLLPPGLFTLRAVGKDGDFWDVRREVHVRAGEVVDVTVP